MTERDIDAVVGIESQVYEFPWSAGIFRDCLRVGYSCWVTEVADQVIGYGILSAGAGEAHILNYCVAPEHQGQGLGLKLLNRLLNLGRWHNARSVFLEVRPSNHRAIKVYTDRGFRVVGRRPNYYPANPGREDALVMALRLYESGAEP